jgi:hypothetical protein
MKIKILQEMKKLAYKSGALLIAALFLVAFTLSAQEVTKDFHKEYKAKQGSKLELNNKYGDIVVTSSESDQVVIDVKVTVKYPNQERAEKLLGYITVEFNEGEDYLSAETIIEDKFNFTGWGNESRRFSIDYHVNMPLWMNLTLENKYGNTDLDDLSGLVDLDIKYGNLSASKLTRGDEKPMSVVNLAYGKGTIDEAGWLEANVRYSGNFTVTKCQALSLDCRYSTMQIGNISSIAGETRYDKIRIENINNLVLDEGYSTINIGTLNNKLSLDAAYGSFNADRVPAGFESVEIDSRYAGVRLGIDESASYNLDARLSYGGIKFNEENYQNKKRIIGNTSSEVSGIVGKEESPKANVKVTASYASIKLY